MAKTAQGGEDSLFALQLRAARRADDLARDRAEPAGLKLHCWLLAEREVLAGIFTDSPGDAARSAAEMRAKNEYAIA
jgi:hypothetical protein